MPSYRLVLDVVDARPEVPPQRVLDLAADVLRRYRRVEDWQLLLTAGVPRLQLRYLIEPSHDEAEDAEAVAVARAAVAEIEAEVCRVGGWVVRRRDGRAPGGWPVIAPS